jgi:hypothetical protein
MNKHNFWMIIGCGIPLLLLFIVPLLGLDSSITLFIFVVALLRFILLNFHSPVGKIGHG